MKILNLIKNYDKNISIFDSENVSLEFIEHEGHNIPRIFDEFWTSKQRQSSSIHEISYRACFKPELPRFFINIFTKKNDVVYDPFSGRGTTVIEAGLLGRRIISNDINPLSEILSKPRFFIPDLHEVEKRLNEIPIKKDIESDMDLSMFYHPETLKEILSLREYLNKKRDEGNEDKIDLWIRMVATNRLSGHSSGFFSVYTLPPNQAVSPERQKKINEKLNQEPQYKNTKEIILKKTRSLLRKITEEQKKNLYFAGQTGLFLSKDARDTKDIADNSVDLTVTSPPFLDMVQYHQDNWLRCWFNGIDSEEISKKITMAKNIEEWCGIMQEVFFELYRITKKGGYVTFEVGEIKKGKVALDEYVIPLGIKAGFTCEGVLVNLQRFTKTSKIWGIENNHLGTNTNRIVVFSKI
ncbi:MAG: DNA methyltransferase [Thermovenabulum sp.]|uniref:DNA methyltransferase n=1 Tax=Thermovenabulum sp. TaxID=3100335 RepID=UPI003C7B190C